MFPRTLLSTGKDILLTLPGGSRLDCANLVLRRVWTKPTNFSRHALGCQPPPPHPFSAISMSVIIHVARFIGACSAAKTCFFCCCFFQIEASGKKREKYSSSGAYCWAGVCADSNHSAVYRVQLVSSAQSMKHTFHEITPGCTRWLSQTGVLQYYILSNISRLLFYDGWRAKLTFWRLKKRVIFLLNDICWHIKHIFWGATFL